MLSDSLGSHGSRHLERKRLLPRWG